jgi:acyl dehydratase
LGTSLPGAENDERPEEGEVAAKEGWRGRLFEDFEVGDVYEHPLGRTVTTTDNL